MAGAHIAHGLNDPSSGSGQAYHAEHPISLIRKAYGI
jgi:hypothetical protein